MAAQRALRDLYEASSGATWSVNQGWMSDSGVCSWRTSALKDCDGASAAQGSSTICCTEDRVTALYLYDNGLHGTLPTTLGLLTSLERLALNENSLSGSMPTQLGMLTHLTTLAVGGNSMSGQLPTMLGKLSACLIHPGNQWFCSAGVPDVCSPACGALPPPPPSPPLPVHAPPLPSPRPLSPPPASVGRLSALLLGAGLGVAGLCAVTCLCAVLLLLCRRRLARRFLSSASGPRLEPPARHASEWRTAKRPVFGAEPPQDGVGGSGDGGGRSERSGGATVPAATPSLPLAPDPPGAPSLADPADNASPDGRVDAAPPAASPAPAADTEDAQAIVATVGKATHKRRGGHGGIGLTSAQRVSATRFDPEAHRRAARCRLSCSR